MNPGRTVQLRSADGVPLVADLRTAEVRGNQPGNAISCVVAHGFTGSARTPNTRRICAGLNAAGIDVLALDLRGHGRSGGRSTLGLREGDDVAAAVASMRAAGYRFVATIGFSMGGTAVVQHAGHGGDTDAVVAVSSPAEWFERGTAPMRVVHWMVGSPLGRVTTRVWRRTRVTADGWDPVPAAPVDVAAAIAPRPLLLVHGTDDRYFPLAHVRALAAAAGSAQVWVESGMGHAESGTSAALAVRIGSWVRDVAIRARAAQVCDDGARDGARDGGGNRRVDRT